MATNIVPNRHLIDAPPSAERRYGLFDAATVVDRLPDRWAAAGVQFPELDCGGMVLEYDAECGTAPVKAFEEGAAFTGGDPYWLYSAYRCGTVGTTAQEAADRVRRRLAGGEQTAVEAIVWTGGADANDPALTTAGATVVTPLAPGAGTALAAIEARFYAEYGYRGVLHVNTEAHAALNDYVDRRGGAGVLTTELGTRVSYGAGYGITGPGGVAPAAGFVWAFMTAPVTVWRGDVIQPDVVQTMNRVNNQWNALAERVYLHAWACDAIYAVQIPVAAPAFTTAPAVPEVGP
jgi:hypothetical protein